MKTIQWQVKKPEDSHWLNVPEKLVDNMRDRGFLVKELVDRDDAQQEIEAARELEAA
jgi:hypothetical protein